MSRERILIRHFLVVGMWTQHQQGEVVRVQEDSIAYKMYMNNPDYELLEFKESIPLAEVE